MNRGSTLVVFAGAGASKAVNSDKYPTTVEFFERLPPEITDDALFADVHTFLKERGGATAQIDIELLLWRLDQLQSFCSAACDGKAIPGWFIRKSRLANTLKLPNSTFGHLSEIAKTASARLKELTAKIHAQVYDFYGQQPEAEDLHSTWIPLLEPLLRSGAVVELFTTNYDMVLEVALDKLNGNAQSPIDTGWRGTVVRRIDTTLWTRRRGMLNSTGLLTKLHGSVNWARDKKDPETIYVSDHMFKGSHARHVIIYPGFKGRPTDPVFQSFHNHLADSLSKAVGVLFIGFAFRDDHINDLCDRALPSSAKVVVIDPDPKLTHQFRHGDAICLGQNSGFDASTATEAAEVLLDSLSAVK